MRLAPTAHRTREVHDGVADGTTIALYEIARGMRWPGSGIGNPRSPDPPYPLHITLRDGFRGHAVVIVVGGREVYRRAGVTTNPTILRADAVELVAATNRVHVEVSVTPGNYVASLDLDVSAHSHLAISLVGEGTVSFEISCRGFT
jgi:hypothetical protein